ncbi:MAG: hypothetical protein L6Q71_02465, partial [Planctomycetes bacterium]|nr:hypothetical protein [Planctomycetota bacterium]
LPPQPLIDEALREANWSSPIFGYTSDEMANLGNDLYRLRMVNNLFRDVLAAPRTAGKISTDVKANGRQAGVNVQAMFGLLGAPAGREFEPPKKKGSWDLKWIPDETSPADAIDLLFNHLKNKGVSDPADDFDHDAWAKLPARAQRLAIQTAVAATAATPFMKQAYKREVFANLAAQKGVKPAPGWLAQYLLSPHTYTDESPEPDLAVFETYEALDLPFISCASSALFVRLAAAIDGFLNDTQEPMPALEFDPITITLPCGDLVIMDTRSQPAKTGAIVIDLGGDEIYTAGKDTLPLGVPASFDQPIGLLIDLGGNDRYECTGPIGHGCGVCGIAGLFDLAGDDQYSCDGAGTGCAIYGASITADYAGNDTYICRKGGWSQGAALCGAGMLIDLQGDDRYQCGSWSQGYGGTLGCGFIVDHAGNDYYECKEEDAFHPTDLYGGQALAMSQGAAFGRRADFGDGHSLAGGVGGMMDFAGDDVYFSHRWTHGCAYWWAFGFLEDHAGNDRYHCVQYSQGSAAHFGVGCFVDLTGNDSYNDDRVAQQTTGAARDASIGVFFDGDGDDNYVFPFTSAGSGNLNAIGLLWDRRGDDAYRLHVTVDPDDKKKAEQTKSDKVIKNKQNIGIGNSVKREGAMGSFRDRMLTLGLFLDTQGKDSYTVPMEFKDNRNGGWFADNTWWAQRNDELMLRGFGLDAERYPAVTK